MATKKDLEDYVAELNRKYCKNTKNHLVIDQAYGRQYQVCLTGKSYFRGSKEHLRKGGLRGYLPVTPYHDTATNTINKLYREVANGYLQQTIKYREHR